MSTQTQPIVLVKLKSGASIDAENYAQYAERFIKQNRDAKGVLFGGLTTTKLRSIYNLIMNLRTKINEPSDFEKYKAELQYLKVRMAYESGREQAVKKFIQKTLLMDVVDHIKTFEQFELYCKYAESLVAYFKFYGGKDK